MAQYKTGSVSVTNGSAVVTGTGTLWVGEVAVGDIFTIVGSNAWYEVGAVNSNTQITLTANYAGATITDSTYAISRDFTANYGLPYPQKGDIETASLIKRAFQDIDSKLVLTSSDGDVTITGDLIVEGSTISLDNATVQTFTWGDNDKAIFGDGSDLQIYHDGANNYVDGVSGAVFVRGSRIDLRGANNELMLVGNQNGSLISYYDNAAKLATTSTGIDVTGLTDTDTLNVSGNTTLGDASTDNVKVNGYMGVGGAVNSTIGVYAQHTALTGSTQTGVYSAPTGTISATSRVVGFSSQPKTVDAVFTASDVIGFYAQTGTKGASSTVTNWYGIQIADQTQGTNNYGITSLVSSGTNKWNIYASGTAANYFAGNVKIGSNESSSARLHVVPSGTDAAFFVSATDSAVDGTGQSMRIVLGSSGGSGSGTILTHYSNDETGTKTYRNSLRLYDTGMIYADATAERLRLSTTEAVFNEPGNDYDFRVESDTNSHAFFLEGSTGNVGIGTSSPSSELHIVDSAANATLILQSSNTGTANVFFGDSVTTGVGRVSYDHSTDSLALYTGSVERIRITSTGLGIGTSSISAVGTRTTLHVAGTSGSAIRLSDDTANAFLDYTDASGMRISVNANEPLTIRTNSQDRLIIDGAGNLGLGVTPSGWGSAYTSLDFAQNGSVASTSAANNITVSSNVYRNSSAVWTYKANDYASMNTQSGGQHAWYTAPSGTAGNAISFTQAMTLTAAGNLGIGTSSPSRKLHVYDTGSIPVRFETNTSDTKIEILTTSGTQFIQGSANNLLFGTNNTERARITSDGHLHFGFQNFVSMGSVNTGVRLTDDGEDCVIARNSNGSVLNFYSGTGFAGSISLSGSSTAYNTSSDYRLKEDWQPMTGASERVKALKPVNFAWKADGSRVDGFLAHEAQAVVPEAVTGTKDAVDADGNPVYQGIDQSKLVPLLTAALQEALAKIESLEARLDAANL